MAMLRSRRLESLFGGDLNKVTAGQVKALVTGKVAEAFDLDLKAQLYGSSEGEKRALASDVAAMANTAGGVLVLGVIEDDQARAAAAPGVDISDVQVARIRQIVAAGVSPLPQFDVIQVPDEVDGHGFILITVPRSALAPHAVLVNESLRFPTRNGATTRHLAEPEVATAYRSRFSDQVVRADRLARIEAAMTEQLDCSSEPWLVVSLVPELPGEFTITNATFKVVEDQIRSAHFLPWGSGQFFHVEVGHERVLARDSNQFGELTPLGQGADLYTDGSGSAAHRLYDLGPQVFSALPQTPESLVKVVDQYLATVILGTLQFLATHARDRCHASGLAMIQVSLVLAESTPWTVLCSISSQFPRTIGRAISTPPSPSRTYADLDDLAGGGPGHVAAAARLHLAIGHGFGVPELGQMTLDGQLSWAHWYAGGRREVEEWAAMNGVDVIGKPAGA